MNGFSSVSMTPPPGLAKDHPYFTMPLYYRTHTKWVNGEPWYPDGVTCSMIGLDEPYFPLDWRFWVFMFLFVMTYIIWPAILLYCFVKKMFNAGVAKEDAEKEKAEEKEEDAE
ncbi:hypothetical protein SLS59_006385 [Nothophoma quercina]|uniref:Uncharacterized protein n=1 Tax=Nothophoma quercina TaxID=749835 RepID=A0ABR3R578_9PLEO